jgi:hypothetical protein
VTPVISPPRPQTCRPRGPSATHLAGLGALLWAALHWHRNVAGLVIAAGVALITVPGPRESGREPGPASWTVTTSRVRRRATVRPET